MPKYTLNKYENIMKTSKLLKTSKLENCENDDNDANMKIFKTS